jgi:peptidyl-Lys metalloendopeptidase
LSYEVELTGAYDLSRSGRYTIEYLSRGAHGAKSTTLRSDKLYLWLEGRSAKDKRPPPPPPPDGNISYTGNCSASQQTTLHLAVENAKDLSGSSTSYLGHLRSSTPRYAEWFGAYTTDRQAIANDHFVKLTDAFSTKPLTLDCKCKKPYYAYVYPAEPYKIYVCRVFWSAPALGTDSQAGTLIHEMSHFTVVAGTDDWAYGQTAARALADEDPVKALDNADSHEYFAENTPPLP